MLYFRFKSFHHRLYINAKIELTSRIENNMKKLLLKFLEIQINQWQYLLKNWLSEIFINFNLEWWYPVILLFYNQENNLLTRFQTKTMKKYFVMRKKLQVKKIIRRSKFLIYMTKTTTSKKFQIFYTPIHILSKVMELQLYVL